MAKLIPAKILESIQKRGDAIALVDLSDTPPRFLLLRRGEQCLKILAKGSLEQETEEDSVALRLRQILDEQSLECTRAAVLLSRPALETVSGTLPPATDDELPELVASLVVQETDDADRVVDFLTIRGANPESPLDVLAMTCHRDMVDSTKADFKESGFHLESMTYCGIGASGLLREIAHPLLPFVVAITSNKVRTELVVLSQGEIRLFRTIQRGCDQSPAFAEALAAELQRTLAFVGAVEEDAVQTYLVGDKRQFEGIASTLSETLSCSVSVVDITDHVDHSEIPSFDSAAGFANLIGVASGIANDDLPLDFLNPRQIPKPPSPWRRSLFWASIAAIVVVVLAWSGWSGRTEQLEAIARKQESLDGLRRRANKSQSLQNILNAVEAWQKNDITWLDEIRDLSNRFPRQNESLVRRLSAQAGSNGTGVLDLSVQVKSPDVVTMLEAAIRDERHSVSSKRVTEITDSADLTWAFETRIAFRPMPKPDLKAAEPTKEMSETKVVEMIDSDADESEAFELETVVSPAGETPSDVITDPSLKSSAAKDSSDATPNREASMTEQVPEPVEVTAKGASDAEPVEEETPQ